MIKHQPSYFDLIGNIYDDKRPMKDLTFQVTEDCNLKCTYCYQINKTHHTMDFETAKTFIDYIFDNRDNPDFYYYEGNTKGFCIEFIGGEPLLAIDLIEQIILYFEKKFLEHPESSWLLCHIYNFSSNGTLYFTPKVQEFFQKYREIVSIGITVDGNKEFHDSCRLFPDGTGSYDIAAAAAQAEYKKGNIGTKITVSPDNIKYLFDSVKTIISKGFQYISINCCFENIWYTEAAIELFNQLVLLSDWIAEKDIYDKIYIAILHPNNFKPINPEQLKRNWCGVGLGSMVSIDYKGNLYPCIRFMPSSLGEDIIPITIGDLENGLLNTDLHKKNNEALCSCTRENINNKECLECPIASGCSWCCGYNYQVYKDLNHKATFICEPYKMSALASKYLCKKVNDKKSFDQINLTYDMYKNLISEKDFNKIIEWEEL